MPLALGPPRLPARLHFWRGASGQRYVHSVYSLIECPPLPKASYMLVRRDEDGRRRCCTSAAARATPTLNLAHVRQRGAKLGANEVHVHFQADDDDAAPARRLRSARRPVRRARLRAPARQRLTRAIPNSHSTTQR